MVGRSEGKVRRYEAARYPTPPCWNDSDRLAQNRESTERGRFKPKTRNPRVKRIITNNQKKHQKCAIRQACHFSSNTPDFVFNSEAACCLFFAFHSKMLRPSILWKDRRREELPGMEPRGIARTLCRSGFFHKSTSSTTKFNP